jgi:uncharacterized protein YecE (DUF72 family)
VTPTVRADNEEVYWIGNVRRLVDGEEGLARLVDSTVPLGDRRGPMLLQLPSALPPDPGRLSEFLDACPEPLRVAVEFRDPAWFMPEVEKVLRRHDAALVWSDYPGVESPPWDTAPFLYVRRHGTEGRFAGRYEEATLEALAATLGALGKDAYCYFNNDADGAAPSDARTLIALLGGAS